MLNGYEYSSWRYGHRNVYFRGEHAPIIRAFPHQAPYGAYAEKHPRALYNALQKSGAPAFTVPHHMTSVDHLFSWDSFSPLFDRMVEVYSGWGNAESAYGALIGYGADKISRQSAAWQLSQGKVFGFVSGSDSHDGFPGFAQGSGLSNWANKFVQAGSGRTVALCEKLSRSTVFDALFERRAYATTGAPILADFSLNDTPMGGVAPACANKHISLQVTAPSPIKRIEILKNGQTLCSEQIDAMSVHYKYNDAQQPLLTQDCYHARITLSDREIAFITPIWIAK